jgi:hypothetical protein
MVTVCTASFNIQTPWILPTQCIYMFHMVLTINNDCFLKRHYLADHFRGEITCFLWGSIWIFMYYSGEIQSLIFNSFILSKIRAQIIFSAHKKSPHPNPLSFSLPKSLPSLSRTCTRTSGHCLHTLKAGKCFCPSLPKCSRCNYPIPTSLPSIFFSL